MSTYPSSGDSQAPKNYIVWSIISLVITVITCCLCYTIPSIATAIVALVFSIKVNNAATIGDTNGAHQASKQAKLWNLITAGLFAAGAVLWIILFFVMGGIDAQREQWEMFEKIMEQQRG